MYIRNQYHQCLSMTVICAGGPLCSPEESRGLRRPSLPLLCLSTCVQDRFLRAARISCPEHPVGSEGQESAVCLCSWVPHSASLGRALSATDVKLLILLPQLPIENYQVGSQHLILTGKFRVAQ